MSATLSVKDQIRQLNGARNLVLRDVKCYQSVVHGILSIIGPTARLELRRWGAEFLAEAFATPALPSADKETMLLYVLDTLQAMVENPQEDAQVLRGLIQTAASIYPLAMRWIINNSYDTMTWEKITAIKTRIFRIWDTAVPSVRICCIKFAQRVVLAQLPSSGVEPKRGDSLDVSLDKVPPNHESLDHRTLEAEATGLLDRILSVLQDNSDDALLVDGTLNSLSILVRARPTTSNRILNAVLNFNPLKLANSPLTPRNRVMVKSMEKTTRLLLSHIAKRDPHNPFISRIQQHVERLLRSRNEILDESSRKRAYEPQPYDNLEAKRQRLAVVPSATQIQIPPLGPGPHSIADLFTLTPSVGLRGFDVQQVPIGIASRVCVSILTRVDTQLLKKAIDGIKGRLAAAAAAPPPVLNPDTAPLGVEDDDDDYEPDFYAAEDTEQILNKLDGASSQQIATADNDFASKTFKLPPPPVLTVQMGELYGNDAVERLLGYLKELADGAKHNPKAGINRLAARFNDRESWFTFASRLASRQDEGPPAIKAEEETDKLGAYDQASHVRDVLYKYIMEDFRKRIDAAVSWLSEEWYKEEANKRHGKGSAVHYEKWTLKLIDGILPFLTPQDKVLTRFFSELPELTPAMLARVKYMCRDPSVTPLALTTLLYLVMMRPPVKEVALDVVQDIWTEFEDARPMAAKYLAKFRPAFLAASISSAAAST